MYDNSTYFLCSLIESLGRATLNRNYYIVNTLGYLGLKHILTNHDTYHSINPKYVLEEIIQEFGIRTRIVPILSTEFDRPDVYGIGRLHAILIRELAEKHTYNETVELIIQFYNKREFIDDLENYDTAFFYANEEYLLESYKLGRMI